MLILELAAQLVVAVLNLVNEHASTATWAMPDVKAALNSERFHAVTPNAVSNKVTKH